MTPPTQIQPANIFLIPGLGFDARNFERLEWEGGQVTHIPWIDPAGDESLRDYAGRLSRDIPASGDRTVIIGHSFGGVLAQEIAAFKRVEHVILMSSIRSREELPGKLRVVAPLGLQRLFTKGMTMKTFRFWGARFGYDTPDLKALFKSMVNGHSNKYLQWALRSLSNWQPSPLPESTRCTQIHGAADRTFPIQLLAAPDHVVTSGGHLMVYQQAPLISTLLRATLSAPNISHDS